MRPKVRLTTALVPNADIFYFVNEWKGQQRSTEKRFAEVARWPSFYLSPKCWDRIHSDKCQMEKRKCSCSDVALDEQSAGSVSLFHHEIARLCPFFVCTGGLVRLVLHV